MIGKKFTTSLGQGSPLHLALLILASEMIYFLPFALVRIFRPTILEVYGMTNLQLGSAMSTYGIVAILGYFPGGVIADRFSSKKLMIISLVLTALLGVPLISAPSLMMLTILYTCWGVSTVVLFWAALIKSVTIWGGEHKQGLAFGLLEGGRGLVSALFATILLFIYKEGLPEALTTITLEHKTQSFKVVLLVIIIFMLFLSMVCMKYLPNTVPHKSKKKVKVGKAEILSILKLPSIWYLSTIIICAYVGFKITGVFSQYAKEALEMSEIDALKYGVVSFYARPVAACLAGYLADKYEASSIIFANFCILFVSSLLMATDYIRPEMIATFALTLSSCCLGIYGLRGLYFTTIKETRIPPLYTGIAIGMISMMGYSPDVFVGPVIGHLIDTKPGAKGLQNVFLFASCFAGVGVIVSICYSRYLKRVTLMK